MGKNTKYPFVLGMECTISFWKKLIQFIKFVIIRMCIFRFDYVIIMWYFLSTSLVLIENEILRLYTISNWKVIFLKSFHYRRVAWIYTLLIEIKVNPSNLITGPNWSIIETCLVAKQSLNTQNRSDFVIKEHIMGIWVPSCCLF